MLRMKFVSSLEKCFLDGDFDALPALERASALRGEVYSFGVAFTSGGEAIRRAVSFSVAGSLPAEINVWKVGNVPVEMAAPASPSQRDGDYLRYGPGLYPDLLTPLEPGERLIMYPGYLYALWVTVKAGAGVSSGADGSAGADGDGDADEAAGAGAVAGDYEIAVEFADEGGEGSGSGVGGAGGEPVCGRLPLRVVGADMPPQRMTVTNWFHCDCLAQYYNVPVFGDRHFEIIENFIKTAVEYGINMILTPVFTPPLDTAPGAERLTTQLVGVRRAGALYEFDFSLLDRWIDICERQGVRVYEISHLFTQWGAAHAPKIMADEGGGYKRIFGWETDAGSAEYAGFLKQFLPALTRHMGARGISKERVAFHISDEPHISHIESYRRAKEIVAPLVEGYEIYDALSDYEFYRRGVVSRPIPSNDHIGAFIEGGVPRLWTYYCLGQSIAVSNRFISMPSARNRVIGAQFYKYRIEGFLHWGYNFYNSRQSVRPVDPYRVTDGEYFGPAGDAFVVYPGADGGALPSIRLMVFHEALQDVRAFELCERLYSREFVLSLIDARGPVTFDDYPKDADYLIELRRKVNEAIAAKI